MSSIVGFGETLIDFIPVGTAEDGLPLFQPCPGGSVSNLCVAAAKLGADAKFIGKVGEDSFGHVLKDTLGKYGVDTSGVVITEEHGTFLAFVYPREKGERDYVFFSKPGLEITMDEIDLDVVKNADILHFSSILLADDVTTDTTRKLTQYAKENGVPISYDLNWRPMLFRGDENGRKALSQFLEVADIIKATEEEVAFITGLDEAAGAKKLLDCGAHAVIVTRGELGSGYYCAEGSGNIEAVKAEAIDTTGAGDCYLGSFLVRLLEGGDVRSAGRDRLEDALRFATIASGISVTRRGAMAGMPTRAEVEEKL